MTLDKKRLPLAVTVAVVGFVLPFLTWGYAKTIEERLVFEELPDPILLAFNGETGGPNAVHRPAVDVRA